MKHHYLSYLTAMMLASPAMEIHNPYTKQMREPPESKPSNKYLPHQGEKEKARRVRQMNRLKAA